MNAITKISARWFGPRGRSFATAMMLFAIYFGFSVVVLLGDKVSSFNFYIGYCIIATVLTLLVIFLFADRPDFSPSMSEEDKLERDFNFDDELKSFRKDKNKLYLAISCICFLINIH